MAAPFSFCHVIREVRERKPRQNKKEKFAYIPYLLSDLAVYLRMCDI